MKEIPNRRLDRVRSWASAAMSLLLATLAVAGCAEPPGVNEQEARREIETMLREYLPKLGQAYGEQKPSVLEGLAVPKEIARIALRVEELETEGRVYEPEFQEVTVEDVSVWNYSNAFVTTVEVWDVRSYTVGSHMLIQESLGQRSRVKYQLKRGDEEGSWVVLYRELEQTFDQ